MGETAKVRASRVHDLKVWPEYMCALLDEAKTFEVRKNDRDFRVGDVLQLREWNPRTMPLRAHGYSGRVQWRVITYVMPGGIFGVHEDYVVLGLAVPEWSSTDAHP